MTISTRRRLLLRHGAGKRTRSNLSSGNGADLASNAWHFRQNSRSVLKLGQDFGMMAASEAANGKSQLEVQTNLEQPAGLRNPLSRREWNRWNTLRLLGEREIYTKSGAQGAIGRHRP